MQKKSWKRTVSAAPRRTAIVVTVASIATLAAVTSLAMNADSEDRPPLAAEQSDVEAVTPSASPKAAKASKKAPAPEPTGTPSIAPRLRQSAEAAEDELTAFVKKSASVLAEGKRNTDSLESSASGVALGEIEAMATQYAKEGYTVSGEPRIIRTAVNRIEDDRAELAVCLDNSTVSVRDATGRDLTKVAGAKQAPVLNIYDLERTDDGWTVVDHRIPARSGCRFGAELS